MVGFHGVALQQGVDVVRDQVNCDRVLRPPRHYDIGVALGGQHECLRRWLDKLLVLLQDATQIAASREHVSPDSSREAHVGVGVDEDLHVE